MAVKLTRRQLIELMLEETLTTDAGVTLDVVETGVWDGADEKYQSLELIFTDGVRFYSGEVIRSGSYFSDWNYEDYGDADIVEVRKVTRTITVERWESVAAVKEGGE